ncbi:cancer/testis antigen 47A-like [Ailuropoda melanoleuca]|uniref:cancer/testis antigen 47A-like n=1 Tax=Ailuropoda melanoleuca TaxID=9646 RepID=UPI00149428CC|nr:cancer/testis antigen 47A-like [Ailuropoda melanoleuca]
MSASGDPGQAPGGQESPVSAAGAWAPEAGDGHGVALESRLPRIEVVGVVEPVGGLWEGLVESGPPGMDVDLESEPPQMEMALESGPPLMEVAFESGIPRIEVAEVAGPVGALGEAAVGLGLARGPEGWSAEAEAEDDDSEFWPAEEGGEEQLEEGPDIIVDAHQFPMVGFLFMFLELVRSLLHRLRCNDHVLVGPGRGGGRARVMVRPGVPPPDAPGWHPAPPAAPPARGAPAAAPESEGSSDEEAAWETAEEPDEEPEDGPVTPKGKTKYQCEKSDKEAEKEEEKNKFNKEQEGPN